MNKTNKICKNNVKRNEGEWYKFFYTRKQMSKLNEEGITLIALVVTIVILLILAGVTLGLVLSDGGLIDKTKQAVIEYGNAQEKEKAELEKASRDDRKFNRRRKNTKSTKRVCNISNND